MLHRWKHQASGHDSTHSVNRTQPRVTLLLPSQIRFWLQRLTSRKIATSCWGMPALAFWRSFKAYQWLLTQDRACLGITQHSEGGVRHWSPFSDWGRPLPLVLCMSHWNCRAWKTRLLRWHATLPKPDQLCNKLQSLDPRGNFWNRPGKRRVYEKAYDSWLGDWSRQKDQRLENCPDSLLS